ncbi:MAG: lipoate--protein ligase family protein [Candidatus Jordarchaeum sp.]|uniref:lipoate--protein ligase family protein n=1 Tax=Candidatus Jordarchaeum sp. TaxID=2823881 RepID=UPI0040493A10
MSKNWRMVTATTDVADWYSGYIPAFMRAMVEGKIPDTVAFFYMDKPAVFLQRYCDALRDVNYDACIENNVKVTRGIVAGGGVIYGEPGVEPVLTVVWNKDAHLELPSQPDLILLKFLGVLADIVSEKYKIPMRYRPLNDLEIWDASRKVFRKIVPSGCSGLFNAIGIASGPQTTKPSELMSKILVSPIEKFADKILKDVQTRTWNLEEAGVYPEGIKELERIRRDWIEMYLHTLKKAFNIEVEEGEWADAEKQYVKEFTSQFGSESWIFARSAEKKFEEIPSGTSLGKAFLKITGGPMVRAYVLREGDIIKDMMFTGTMHMVPADALEKLEKELIGLKIDNKTIKEKVHGIFEGGAEIGLMREEQLLSIILEACKLSYEEPS